MSLSITGMSSSLALQLLDATQTQEKAQIQNDPANARAIASFEKDAATVTTAKSFVNDYPVYSFVMQAYDLKDQMFGKAMVQQILSSDSSVSTSLVNKMTDPRLKALYNGLDFTGGGATNTTFASTDWQNQTVQKFVDQTYINDISSQNATVGTALEFRQKAASATSWYNVLGDTDLFTVMRTVLGMPAGMSSMDLTQQVALLSKSYDIKKLQDPTEVNKLVQRFVLMSDAQNSAASAASNPAVQMLSQTLNNSGGSYTPVTFDISSINVSAFSAAKLYG